MDETMGSEGFNKLAGVLQGRMKDVSHHPQVLDFGEVQGDMSVMTNRFPQPIPKGDYVVCRHLTLGAADGTLTETKTEGEHIGHSGGSGAHGHEIKIPEKMRKLMPGDRVLVAWAGDDLCIVDIILPGDSL